MATPQRDLKVQFLGDANSLIRAADKARRALDDTEKSAKKTDKGLDLLKKGALALGGAFAASKIADFVGDSIQLGIAAEEAGNKFNAVFGPAAGRLGDELDALGDKAGIADFELRNMVATTGNVLLGLGGTTQQAADFSSQLAPLAVDLASFNGEVGNAPDVLKAMTSALTGEREALKTYGVVIKEADVQQRALQISGKDAASELTNLEKATATMQLIMEGAGAAVGDLDRNLDTAATTQARLSAEWKEAQAELGQRFLPVFVDLAEVAIDLVPLMEGVADAVEGILGPTQDLLQLYKDVKGNFDDSAESGAGWLDIAQRIGDTALNFVNPAMAEYKRRQEEATDATDDSSAALDAHRHSVDRNRDSVEEIIDSTGDAAQESEFWARTLGRSLDPALEESRKKLDEMTGSLAEQRDELRKAADPVYALRDAQQKLADAQATLTKLQDDGKAGTQEYEDALFDLVSASADAKVAQGQLSDSMVSGGGAIAAFRDMAEAAGLSKEEIDELIGSILRYNDTDPEGKTFGFEVQLPGGGTGFTVGGGNIIALAEGGKVSKGGLAVVGEQGPELVRLPQSAEVYPTGVTPAPSGGGGPITVQLVMDRRVIDEIVIDSQRRNSRRGRAV